MPSTFLGMAPTFTTTYFIMEALALLSIELNHVSTSGLDRWLIRDAPHITTAIESIMANLSKNCKQDCVL